ncbi:MAG TPA: hypothetical protein VHX87_13760 [Galbitalea sp.]|jgi:hypothetical protein|nr:hypothetical protein [Galbitalea sp.]
MSAVAYATPIRRPREEEFAVSERRHVRIVTTRAQRKSRPKLVYALWASVVIFAIFLVQLMITIALSSGAYQISGLQGSQQNLSRTASALGERLDTLASSQNLAANAKALGMVGSGRAAFLRLSDGAVLGTAAPAGRATISASAIAALETTVPNSLLDQIPLINGVTVLSPTTGTGHGSTNAPNSTASTPESTQGQIATASAGTNQPATTPSADNGELPSPVTH